MSPWEMKAHIAYITGWTDDEPRLEAIAQVLDRFVMAWGGTWARFGTSDQGLADYIRHLTEVKQRLAAIEGPPVLMRNGWPMLDSLNRYVFGNAILPAKLRALQAAAGRAPQYRLSA